LALWGSGVDLSVIARSISDEAIHSSACCAMDCFASLAMTEPVSRSERYPLALPQCFG
jgi:hypothetical protein